MATRIKLKTSVLFALLILSTLLLWDVRSACADVADDLINELICPTASGPQPLAVSSGPEAVEMKAFIQAKNREGWSRDRIVETLAHQYGEQILPASEKRGFGLTAWVAPYALLLTGVAVLVAILVSWNHNRRLSDAYADAEMSRTIDENRLKRYENQVNRELERFE